MHDSCQKTVGLPAAVPCTSLLIFQAGITGESVADNLSESTSAVSRQIVPDLRIHLILNVSFGKINLAEPYYLLHAFIDMPFWFPSKGFFCQAAVKLQKSGLMRSRCLRFRCPVCPLTPQKAYSPGLRWKKRAESLSEEKPVSISVILLTTLNATYVCAFTHISS